MRSNWLWLPGLVIIALIVLYAIGLLVTPEPPDEGNWAAMMARAFERETLLEKLGRWLRPWRWRF